MCIRGSTARLRRSRLSRARGGRCKLNITFIATTTTTFTAPSLSSNEYVQPVANMTISLGSYTSQPPFTIKTPAGTATQVSLNVFFDAFLPRSDIDLDSLMHDGVENELISSTGRMWGYKSKTPGEMPSSRAFQYMQSRATKLAHSVRRRDSRLVYLNNPKMEWLEDDRDRNAFPDACLVFDDEQASKSNRGGRRRRRSSPKSHSISCWDYRSSSDSSSGSESSSASSSSSKEDHAAAIDWMTIVVSGAYSQRRESKDKDSVGDLYFNNHVQLCS